MENNEKLNNQVNESNNVEKEKKNNNKIVGIVVLVISLLLLGFTGYKLFIEKSDTDKPRDDNTQDNGNNNQPPINNSNLDLSQIVAKSFEVRKFEPNKLELIQDRKIFELVGENNASLYVNVDGTKVTIKYRSKEKNITKEIDNVSKVFYSDYGECSPHVLVYVETDKVIYLINIDDYSDLYEEKLNESNFVKEISNTNKYVDIYMDYLHPATCDFIPLWLGRTSDGKYYDLKTSTEYKDNTYFYYDDGNNYVKNDKTYKLGNYSGKIKIGFINAVYEGLVAYIDENDYYYEMDYEKNEFKLPSKEKVTEVKTSNDKLMLTFADGNKMEIEMVYLEAYK